MFKPPVEHAEELAVPDLGLPAEAGVRWVECLRADLLAELDPVVGHCQKLLGDAREQERPNEYLATANKMHHAAQWAYQFVRHVDRDADVRPDAEGFDQAFAKFRHDLKNMLNQTLGYCQLLMLDESEVSNGFRELSFDDFTPELQRIEKHCRLTEAVLLRYMQQRPAADDDASSESWDASTIRLVDTEQLLAGRRAVESQIEPGHVLVADDNVGSREVLCELLKKQGHLVTEVADGSAALAAVESGEFDLLLIDVLMPGMNGFQVLEQIKNDPRFRHLPVILISGLDRMEDVIWGIEAGAEDYLTKPVNQVLLKARVNSCLAKQQMRLRELEQFFPAAVARRYARRPDLLVKGRDAEVTVLFGDIRGFSRISERLEPAQTVRWLSDVMDALSVCVLEHQGTLVDYIGDEIMAMWGAPEEQPHHALLAARAAMAMLKTIPELNARWQPKLGSTFELGIGLNSGMARVGNTGSSRKFKYGPLGNTVNLASRVQGATKYLRTSLLLTEDSMRLIGDSLPTRRLSTVRVTNILQPVGLYEVVLSDDPYKERDLITRYEQALQHFEHGEFFAASAAITALLADYRDDAPSLLLLSRAVQCQVNPTVTEFDPVWELPGK